MSGDWSNKRKKAFKRALNGEKNKNSLRRQNDLQTAIVASVSLKVGEIQAMDTGLPKKRTADAHVKMTNAHKMDYTEPFGRKSSGSFAV